MTIYRTFGFLAASLVLAAPLYATAEEATPQAETLQCTESDLGAESLESSEAMSPDDGEGGECRPLLQSCNRNSQCCANLCVLGLCL